VGIVGVLECGLTWRGSAVVLAARGREERDFEGTGGGGLRK